jgi:hypothetical protein
MGHCTVGNSVVICRQHLKLLRRRTGAPPVGGKGKQINAVIAGSQGWIRLQYGAVGYRHGVLVPDVRYLTRIVENGSRERSGRAVRDGSNVCRDLHDEGLLQGEGTVQAGGAPGKQERDESGNGERDGDTDHALFLPGFMRTLSVYFSIVTIASGE